MVPKSLIRSRLARLEDQRARAEQRSKAEGWVVYGGVAALGYALETMDNYDPPVAEAHLWYILQKMLTRMNHAAEANQRSQCEHCLNYAQEMSWVLEMSEIERERALEFIQRSPRGYSTARHYARGDYQGEKQWCPYCGAPVFSLEPYCGLCGCTLIPARNR